MLAQTSLLKGIPWECLFPNPERTVCLSVSHICQGRTMKLLLRLLIAILSLCIPLSGELLTIYLTCLVKKTAEVLTKWRQSGITHKIFRDCGKHWANSKCKSAEYFLSRELSVSFHLSPGMKGSWSLRSLGRNSFGIHEQSHTRN